LGQARAIDPDPVDRGGRQTEASVEQRHRDISSAHRSALGGSSPDRDIEHSAAMPRQPGLVALPTVPQRALEPTLATSVAVQVFSTEGLRELRADGVDVDSEHHEGTDVDSSQGVGVLPLITHDLGNSVLTQPVPGQHWTEILASGERPQHMFLAYCPIPSRRREVGGGGGYSLSACQRHDFSF
jgi:hypothetical protein